MDKKIADLFQQWLSAFGAMQVATNEADAAKAHKGLHCFLNEHADAASAQSDSAYRDLVRLTDTDPAVEITKRFEQVAA
jgi:hypothetical protein